MPYQSHVEHNVCLCCQEPNVCNIYKMFSLTFSLTLKGRYMMMIWYDLSFVIAQPWGQTVDMSAQCLLMASHCSEIIQNFTLAPIIMEKGFVNHNVEQKAWGDHVFCNITFAWLTYRKHFLELNGTKSELNQVIN